jgi:ABC-type multidrug transport system permease subunit
MLLILALLVLTTAGAHQLVIEREQGLIARLSASPLSGRTIVLGKWLGRISVGLLQIACGAAAGSLLFPMDWGPNPFAVALVLATYAAFCASAGLWLGSIARTSAQAMTLGVVGTNLVAGLGGAWFPLEIAPAWMRPAEVLLPTGWAMDALHRLIWYQRDASSVALHLAAMVLAAIALAWLAARRLRSR